MKHKYVFAKDTDTGEILITEYAELSKDVFSPICESSYEVSRLENALSQGTQALVSEMRTRSFYPPGSSAERIVQGLSELLSSDDQEMVEIYCDDTEFLAKALDKAEDLVAVEDSEDETEDETLDEFIEELPDTLSNTETVKAATPDADGQDDSPADAG